jgi:predicted RNA polymerase sigma factor
MLLAALGPHWPERAQAKFTITPGGFVHGRWPIGTALSMTTSAPKAFYVTAAVSASLRRPTSFAPPTRSAASTDWHQIVLLYDRLLVVQPSPVVELNRAVAVAMHEGPEHGLRLVDDLLARDELASYHLAHAARAELCRRLGRLAEARASYEKALSLARHEPARRFLSGRLGALK